MTALPTGTVTFLFTDIEGSTDLLQRLGDRRYAEVLAEHQRLLRAAFATGNGQEIDTQGDAFLVAFARARDAVAAAVAAQQALMKHAWPDGALLQVRMGLHTGEPVSETGSYIGLDVHRAARICSAGHGSQILLSQTVADLAARDLPTGVSLRDLGTHRLKDLREPEHLLQVVHPELLADFPPLKSLDTRPNNLPLQLTSFVGRGREIAEVKRLLGAARLVTLTGSGGAGKTRLAIQVAADVVEGYPDGVWLAEFAPIADPALVPKTVASALNVPEQPGRGMTDTLVDALRRRTLLLVLDNCEHLLAACADLAAALLRTCSQVHILATSREGMGVPGETLWRVPSLSLPNARRLPTPEDLVLYEAVRLFVDRAMATAPGFGVTSENASAVAQVCHRLDGIPLAIELAAARVKVLAVEQIAARLDDRFRLLTGGSRMVLPRQQTLRAAIEWSYNLLSETERALFRRLSVFAGGWTLEAAEAVCAGGGAEADQVLDVLTSLVDKSLALAEMQRGEARYRLLETVRQYGGDRLEESGESGDLKRRHLAWYLGVVERAEPKLRGPEQEPWLDWLETEYDNLRAALAWGRTDAQSAEAWLRLTGALSFFWWVGEHWTEGRRWAEEALTRGNDADPASLLRILRSAGGLAYRQGDYDRAGQVAVQMLVLSRTLENKEGIMRALSMSGLVTLEQRDPAGATPLLEESLALSRDVGDKWLIAFQLLQLADTVRALGDYERAMTLGMESINLCRQVGDRWRTAAGLRAMGIVSLRQRDYGRAAAFYTESLPLCGRRYRWVSFQCLEGLGCVASARGQHVRAARLFGAAELVRESLRSNRDSDYQPEIDQHINATQTSLGRASFEAAYAEGRAMTLEQAIEYALAEDSN